MTPFNHWEWGLVVFFKSFIKQTFITVSKNTFWMAFKGRYQSSGCLMYTFRFQLFVPSFNGLDFMIPFNHWEWGLVVFFKSFVKHTFITVFKNTFWMASKGRYQSSGCLMYTFRFQLFVPSSNSLDFMTPFNYWEWGLVVFFKSFIKQTFTIVSKSTFWMASKGRHQSSGMPHVYFKIPIVHTII